MLFYQRLYFASACATLQYDDEKVMDHVHVQVLFSDSHETQKVKPNGCFRGLEAYGLNLLANYDNFSRDELK